MIKRLKKLWGCFRMTKVVIYVVMQYDSSKYSWSAYACFDELIDAEMTASSLNKNAKGFEDKFSYKVVEFSPTEEGVF